MIAIDPNLSVRVISERLGFPRSTVHRVLSSARLHPYRLQFHQATPYPDPLRRMEFCQWALRQIERIRYFFRFVMFSDESTFNNRGQVNRWNFRYWSDQNPHWVRQLDHQHRWSLNVWCGIINGQIIGPHFFEGSVTGVRYLDFLQNELPNLLEDLDLHVNRCGFSRTVHPLTGLVMFETIWTQHSVEGGLVEMVLSIGLQGHLILPLPIFSCGIILKTQSIVKLQQHKKI